MADTAVDVRWRGDGQGCEWAPGATSITLPGSFCLWKGSKELAGTVVGLSPVGKEKMRSDLAKEGKERMQWVVSGLTRGIKQTAAHAVTCWERQLVGHPSSDLRNRGTKVDDLLVRKNMTLLKRWRERCCFLLIQLIYLVLLGQIRNDPC